MANRTDRRMRRDRTRMYRRRRLFALAAVLVLVAVVAAATYGVTVGRRDAGRGSNASASTKPDGTPTANSSQPASPSPSVWTGPPSDKLDLRLRKVLVSADISPKSVVSTGAGYVFAQNMMYRHTITVYDTKTLTLRKTIQDTVHLAKFGVKGHSGTVRGAPVEAAVTPDKRFMFISNYSMYGNGFYKEGHDVCSPANGYDASYVYRVPLSTLKIDEVIHVGSVPKYVAITPDQKYLLVSNWCSYTLSIVDVHTSHVVKSVYLGPYPRGIAVDPQSRYAYVAVMGSYNIARVDLRTFKLSWINGVGSAPRHLCMAGNGKYLYATLNGEGNVAKIDPVARTVVAKVHTGTQPRSMAIAPDGKSLYVVNYDSSTMTKVRTRDMKVIQTVSTNALPIGITYDLPTKSVWVCCYTGSIMVFADR